MSQTQESIHRSVDPRECLEMEIKEDLSIPRPAMQAIKQDPSLMQHDLHVSTSQTPMNNETGFFIQVS